MQFANLKNNAPSRLGQQNTLTAYLLRVRLPGYDTKQSDCEASVMLELWGMHSIVLLPFLLGPLWPELVAPDRVLSTGQIELNSVLMLNWIVWNRTVKNILLDYRLTSYHYSDKFCQWEL